MARLPKVGGDDNNWGQVLNDYLSVEHDAEGKLRQDGSLAAKYSKPSSGIPKSDLSSSVQASLDNADAAVAGSVPDGVVTDVKVASGADISQSKIHNLSSDLAGKEPTVAGGTTAQYYRGDKSWQTLDKTAVGLNNVDNTSDANKPVSSATLTALNGKVPTSRQIIAGTGLSGGGDLSADRTLSVTPNTTTQKVEVASGGTLVGSAHKRLNFVSGATVTENTGTDSIDISISVGGSSIVLNVKDNGVLGNNSADDTTALQTLITNAPAGATIYFPAGTYLISSPIVMKGGLQYIGAGAAMGSTAAIIKAKSGSNMTAAGGVTGLFVPQGWSNNTNTADSPIVISNLVVHGNSTNNVSGQVCGIIMSSFWSRIENCYIVGTNLDGILLPNKTADGTTTMTDIGSENRILNNHFQSIGRDAVRQLSSTNANLDGYCQNNTVQNTNGSAFNYANATGWYIQNNHTYGVKQHAIFADNAYATNISNNYLEDFGAEDTAGTTYYGIYARCFAGRGVTVRDNFISCAEPGSATAYHYLWVDSNVSSGSVTPVTINGNKARRNNSSDSGKARSYTLSSGTSGGITTLDMDGNVSTNIGKASQILNGQFVRRKPRPGAARPRTGEYLATGPGGSTTTIASGDVNRMFLMPIDLVEETDISFLAISVSTAIVGTGVTARLGLYADNGYGDRPAGAPLFDVAVDVATGTGAKDVSLGGSQRLLPGRYWGGFAVLGATGFTVSTSLILSAPIMNMINQNITALSLTNLGANNWRNPFQTIAADSSALPTIGTLSTAGNNPLIALKVT